MARAQGTPARGPVRPQPRGHRALAASPGRAEAASAPRAARPQPQPCRSGAVPPAAPSPPHRGWHLPCTAAFPSAAGVSELQRQPRAIPLSREGFGRVTRATRFCKGRLPAALPAICHVAIRCFHKNIFTTFSLLPQDFSLNPRQVPGKHIEQVQDRICTLKTSIS